MDILSGCYWSEDDQAGHIELLLGEGELTFASATPLLTESGQPVRNEQPEENDEDDESDEEKQPGEDIRWSNICTHQHAVDYDGDDDLDLVCGNIRNDFFYIENAGSSEEPMLSDVTVQLNARIPAQHGSPHLVDWDGDGDLDLISGSSNGGAYLAENSGSREVPKWSTFKELVPGSNKNQQSTDDGGQILPAPATRVWVTDWNRDGKLDLLVGDSVTITNRKPGLSDVEFKKLKREFDDAMKKELKAYTKVQQEYQDACVDGEPGDEITDKMSKASQAFSEVGSMKSEFLDESRTGHVWLFVQL